MRIEIHVKTDDAALAVREKYRGPAFAGDEVVIIVDQPVAAAPAEQQARKQPKGEF